MSIQQTASDSILVQAELEAKTLALLIGKYSDGRAKKIGLEVEMPYFETATLKPIPFSGPKSIVALFNGLSRRATGWKPCEVENGHVTSLSSTLGMITLEPGGQVEFASAPKDSIAALGKDIATYLSDSREISAKLGIDVLPFGFHPHTQIEDCPYIDQRSRFKSLRPVFEAEGGFAAAAEFLGKAPALYHVDAGRSDALKVRTLAEEVARVVRGRAANPALFKIN